MTRFLADVMCGKLATYLRMCGFDTAYALERDATDDEEVVAWAHDEGRTVLTRDESLAATAPDAILLSSRKVTDQLATLREAGYDVSLPDAPTRCSRCNAELTRVAADEPRPDYAPDADEQSVWRCPDCDQHFWRGSHWDDVRETLASLA